MTEKQRALCALLAIPDPPEMPIRSHHQTQIGIPEKQIAWRKYQAFAYVEIVRSERSS